MSLHPPSISSMRRPLSVLVRLSGSGDKNLVIAFLAAGTDTLAMPAIPGTLAHTLPRLSAIASIVIQTTRVSESSAQTVLAVIEENSFVKVTLMVCQIMSTMSANVKQCQTWSITVNDGQIKSRNVSTSRSRSRSRSKYLSPTPLRFAERGESARRLR